MAKLERGCVGCFFFFIFLRYFHRAPAASYFRNAVVEMFQNTRHFAMLTPPQLIDESVDPKFKLSMAAIFICCAATGTDFGIAEK